MHMLASQFMRASLMMLTAWNSKPAAADVSNLVEECESVITSLNLVDAGFDCFSFDDDELIIDTENFNEVITPHIKRSPVYGSIAIDSSNLYSESDAFKLFTEIALRIFARSTVVDITRIRFLETFGYCSEVLHHIVFELDPDRGHLRVFMEGGGYFERWCMLDFRSIARYEMAVKAAYSELSPVTEKSVQRLKVSGASTFLSNAREAVQNSLGSGRDFDALLTGENFLIIKVSDVRGVVIGDGEFWERIQYHFFVVEERGTEIEFLIALDGQYSPGLQPPAAAGYYDMQPKYTQDLFDYGQRLISTLGEATSE